MDKPLVQATFLVTLGIILGKYLPPLPTSAIYLAGIMGLVALSMLLLRKILPAGLVRYLLSLSAGFLLIAAGFFRYSMVPLLPANHIRHFTSPERVEVRGVIASDPIFKRHRVRFIASCHEIVRNQIDQKVYGRLEVVFHGPVKDVAAFVQYGIPVRLRGKITPIEERGNPGEFSRRRNLAAKGIYVQTRIYKTENLIPRTDRRTFNLTTLILDLKHRVENIIDTSLPDATGQPGSLQSVIMEALMLGNQEQIPWAIKDNFRGAGVIHTLVVSGLHVGFIWFLGNLIFSPLPLRWRHAAIIPLVVSYVFISGARNPAIRAGLMATIFSLSYLLNQPRNIGTAVAGSALCLLLYNPLNLFQPGFQLSYLIVISIIALAPALNDWFRFLPKKLRPWITVPLSAQLGALPLTAYYFQFISPLAIIGNILVVPLVGVIISFGFIAVLFGFIFTPLATLINYPNRMLILLLLKLVGLLSRLPLAGTRINLFPPAWVFIYFILLAGVSGRHYFRVHWRLGLTGAVVLLLVGWGVIAWPRNRPALSAYYFNGESGNLSFLQTADRTTLLIASDDDPFEEIRKIVQPFLFKNGIRKIDYLIFTQVNPDHLNTLRRLLETVSVGTVLDHPLWGHCSGFSRFPALLAEHDIKHQTVSRGDVIKLGSITLSWIWPPLGLKNHFQREYSSVFTLQIGKILFLFPSEIGIPAQETILKEGGSLKATVLKVPRRGSRTHNLPAFLQKVNPEYALLIQGRKYFGRYPADCSEELKKLGAKIYKSSQEGCIIVETDGETVRVRTNREQKKQTGASFPSRRVSQRRESMGPVARP